MNSSTKKYRHTVVSCYLGSFTQAITANFAPLLFLTFKDSYGISLELLALIPMIFFFSQLLIDLLCSKFADKIGYRKCIVASQAFSSIGLIMMAILPDLLPSPLLGLLLSVICYAVGSGLVEVLVSPIIEACPFENKEKAMSFLHSIYCLGTVIVILGSTAYFQLFGIHNWKVLALLFAVIPLINVFNFSKCPIEKLVSEGEGMGIKNLLKTPIFWLMLILMVSAGSSELAMAQWASAFVESGLGLPKALGDLIGPCLFAVSMGLSRFLYGKFAEKIHLSAAMLASGILCVACYLLASLVRLPALGLVGCALCGFSVGIMWPGSICYSSKACPAGGTAMFAFLALAGDLGGAIGPGLVGGVSELANGNLKVGLLSATIFPLILVFALILAMTLTRKKKTGE